jgi:hypothetical protein
VKLFLLNLASKNNIANMDDPDESKQQFSCALNEICTNYFEKYSWGKCHLEGIAILDGVE